jgi:hypothetical protein
MTQRTLYVICCTAPPALHVRAGITQAQARGWDVCLITTPTAGRWLETDVDDLATMTGHPVRSHYKLPGEPDALPPADAMIVAPATSNTLNKWALGISDTLALGLITEAIGKRLPLVALPYLNSAQADHPAFARNVAVLREANVTVLLGPGGYTPHEPGQGNAERFPWNLALDTLDTHPALPDR